MNGTIPTEFGKMTSLEVLGIGKLGSLYVANILVLVSLPYSAAHFVLDDLAFTGTIPTELGLLTSMKQFRIGMYFTRKE